MSTARTPKPRKASPRKRSNPKKHTLAGTHAILATRVAKLESEREPAIDLVPAIAECMKRLDALETRKRFRDASHDEPVSNAGEAIGQHFRIFSEAPHTPWWRRLLAFANFMDAT